MPNDFTYRSLKLLPILSQYLANLQIVAYGIQRLNCLVRSGSRKVLSQASWKKQQWILAGKKDEASAEKGTITITGEFIKQLSFIKRYLSAIRR